VGRFEKSACYKKHNENMTIKKISYEIIPDNVWPATLSPKQTVTLDTATSKSEDNKQFYCAEQRKCFLARQTQ
jgi:hypothetical protein